MRVENAAGEANESPVRALARLSASQHGVFTRAQALACGIDRGAADRRLSSGVWDRLHPGVYRIAGAPATWHQALLAACLASGEGAVVSHSPAAALRALPGFAPGGIELTLPPGHRVARAFPVHRATRLDAVDVTTINAIPVTSVARTLIDVARHVSETALEEALDDALRRRLATLDGIGRRLQELRGSGRPGTGRMWELVRARAGGRAIPQNVFETRLLRRLRAAGLPTPAVQHEVRTHLGLAVPDFAYVEEQVAIEADGFLWHSTQRQWDHDRARGNALAMLGWTIIRVTWPQLRDRPDEVVETIRATLSRARERRAEP